MIVECPTCGQKGNVPDRESNRMVRCKRCQGSFCVPSAEPLEAAIPNEPQDDTIHPLVYVSLAIALGVVTVLGVMLWRGGGDESTSKQVAEKTQPASPSTEPPPSRPETKVVPQEEAVAAAVEENEPAISPPPPDETKLSDKIAEWEQCVVTVNTNHGEGSGFVVAPGNRIVTNFHVIALAKWGSIRLKRDGAPIPVKVVAIDPTLDLAILQSVWPKDLDDCRYLELAEEAPSKGVQVIAIGNPLGLAGTVSPGMVSGTPTGTDLQRSYHHDYGSDVDFYGEVLGYSVDMNWIQNTAAINPGNSGGPLIDQSSGKVLGVNTLRKSDAQGVGFAVSVSHVRELLRRCGDTSIAWSDLPVPKSAEYFAKVQEEEDRIRNDAKKENERRLASLEADRIRAEGRRRQQILDEERRDINENRRLVSRIETQEEMSRINDRAIAVRGEIESLESQRLILLRQLSLTSSQGRTLEIRVAQLTVQYQQIAVQVATLTSSINNQMIDGVIYRTGRELEFEAMKLDRDALLLQGGAIEDEVSRLRATYAGLANDVNNLQSQVASIESTQQTLGAALADLESQYRQIQALLGQQ